VVGEESDIRGRLAICTLFDLVVHMHTLSDCNKFIDVRIASLGVVCGFVSGVRPGSST